jgi:hypothetical protein
MALACCALFKYCFANFKKTTARITAIIIGNKCCLLPIATLFNKKTAL